MEILWAKALHSMHEYLAQIMFMIAILFVGVVIANERLNQPALEKAREQYGEQAFELIMEWDAILKNSHSSEDLYKLKQINNFFNSNIEYLTDDVIWQKKDYWATPLETMGMRKGDCEDYVIAKYFSLLFLGIDTKRLRLVYVKAKLNGRLEAHMVLAYYPSPNAVPLILDNLRTEILPANKRRDLTPVYSFNSAGLWVGQERNSRSNNPSTRMSRWRQVLARMQVEGFKQ